MSKSNSESAKHQRKCRVCQKNISASATICPHCGESYATIRSRATTTSKLVLVAVISSVLGSVITWWMFLGPREDRKLREQVELELSRAEVYVSAGAVDDAITIYSDLAAKVPKSEFPTLYGRLRFGLGDCFKKKAVASDEEQNLSKAIPEFVAALETFDSKEHPCQNAAMNNSLGGAYWQMSTVRSMRTNATKAIQCFRDGLTAGLHCGH